MDRVLEAEKVTRKALRRRRAAPIPTLVRKVTEKLAAALEVQGFLIAVLPEERLQRTAVLHLLAAGNAVRRRLGRDLRRVRVLPALPLRGRPAGHRLPALERASSPWTRFSTRACPCCASSRAARPPRPAIQPAEVRHGADGKPIKADRRPARRSSSRRSRRTSSSVHSRARRARRTVELTLAETPQEIPLNEPTLLYNKVMMDLRQQVEGYPGTEPAAFARLNLALCAMHFGDFAAAHEHLTKAKAELPQRPGLSQGTALYYLGVALERLGYQAAGDRGLSAPPPASRTRRSSTTTGRRSRPWPPGGAGP